MLTYSKRCTDLCITICPLPAAGIRRCLIRKLGKVSVLLLAAKSLLPPVDQSMGDVQQGDLLQGLVLSLDTSPQGPGPVEVNAPGKNLVHVLVDSWEQNPSTLPQLAIAS